MPPGKPCAAILSRRLQDLENFLKVYEVPREPVPAVASVVLRQESCCGRSLFFLFSRRNLNTMYEDSAITGFQVARSGNDKSGGSYEDVAGTAISSWYYVGRLGC